MDNTVATWKFGELWQTLTFFEIVPNFNFWERLFPGDSSKSDKQTKMTILVAGATGGVGKRVIKKLLAQNYHVRDRKSVV